jgi:hypothetical protein
MEPFKVKGELGEEVLPAVAITVGYVGIRGLLTVPGAFRYGGSWDLAALSGALLA